MKLRQDAWLEENDELLAQAVIRHVREGSTQLNAFEEAGDLLNRTAAACGFRWNAVVRKKYANELQEAKKERKEKLRVMQATKKRTPTFLFSSIGDEPKQPIALSQLSLDIVIAYLMRLQQQDATEQMATKWRMIASKSKERVLELEKKVQALEEENKHIKQDYKQFVQIMNRARKMVAFQDSDDLSTPVFKMERNGNLIRSNKSEDVH